MHAEVVRDAPAASLSFPFVQRDHHVPAADAPPPAGGPDAPAADQSEWSPVLFHGSASGVVDSLMDSLRGMHPRPDTSHLVLVVSTGTRLIVFVNGARRGSFPLAEGAAQLPAGLFRLGSGHVEQLMERRGASRRDWFPVTTDPEHIYIDLLEPGQRPGYEAALRAGLGGGRNLFFMRPAVLPGTEAGDHERGGEGAGGEGEGAGGAGGEGAAPPIPRWATIQFRVVRDRVASEKHRITEMAGRSAGEHDPGAVGRMLELGAVPDRVLLGMDGTDAVIQVRVGRRHGGLTLREGQGPGLLWGRVQTVTRALYAGLSPTRRSRAEDLLLGIPGGPAPDADTVPANTEGYPSEIVNLGADTGISGSLHRFSMRIDWSVEGQWGTLAAFGPRRYQWDIVRLRTSGGALAGRGDVRRSHRTEAAGAEMDEGFHEIYEDAEHSVDEEIIDPGTAALMVTDAGIRSIGTLVGSFVTLASQPSNEQGVRWDQPGTYVVRCISARPPLDREDAPPNPVVRAPSVALYPIRVITRTDMAAQLTGATDLRSAEAALAALLRRLETASDEERPALEAQIADARAAVARARASDEAGMTAHLAASDRTIDEQLALAQLLVRLRGTNAPPERWQPDVGRWLPSTFADRGTSADMVYGMVVGLHVQLTLGGRSPETLIAELRRGQEQVRRQRSALSEVTGDIQGPAFRPHMGFVPRLQGQTLPLLMMLAEHTGSRDGHRRWTLVDLSTPGHHDEWEGYSRTAGPAGHANAIRAALREFAHDVPYGRGTIGVRLPEAALTEYTGGSVTVPATMEARPGPGARWRERLESLATAAGVAAMVVTGPAGVALGVVSAVAGGAMAAYRIHRRYEGGYLEMDLATAMDITAVVGAVVAPAGAWAGGVRATSRWVAIADRVETGARVFGYLQMGSQVFVIPVTLAQELQAIGNDPHLTPGERAARRAMAFLNATRSGFELAVGAYQAISEHAAGPRVREGGPVPEGGPTTEGGPATEGGPTPRCRGCRVRPCHSRGAPSRSRQPRTTRPGRGDRTSPRRGRGPDATPGRRGDRGCRGVNSTDATRGGGWRHERAAAGGWHRGRPHR